MQGGQTGQEQIGLLKRLEWGLGVAVSSLGGVATMERGQIDRREGGGMQIWQG